MSLADNNPFVTSILKRDLLFTCSIADTDLFIADPDADIYEQTRDAVKQLIENCEKHGMTKQNLRKLAIYYVNDPSVDSHDLLDTIARQLDCDALPVVTLIPLSRKHPNQIKIIIDAVAKNNTQAPPSRLASTRSDFSAAIRCGEIIFIGGLDAFSDDHQVQHPDDIVAQSHCVLAKLDAILNHFGASKSDIVKINNWYVAGGNAEQWSQSAKVRAAYYPEPGPVATGLPVKSLDQQGLLIQTDCWVMLDEQNQSIDKQFSWPANHWDWPIHLPFKHGLMCRDLIFIGGQVSMDSQANVIDPDNIVRQSHTSMKNIAAVLNEFDAKMTDIVKMTAFYQSHNEPEDLSTNLAIRADHLNLTCAQSISIPLEYLAYQGMLTEFEIIAVHANTE